MANALEELLAGERLDLQGVIAALRHRRGVRRAPRKARAYDVINRLFHRFSRFRHGYCVIVVATTNGKVAIKHIHILAMYQLA